MWKLIKLYNLVVAISLAARPTDISVQIGKTQHVIEVQARLLCWVPALFGFDVEHLTLRGKKRVA